MNAMFLALAMVAAQADPPRGGDRPVDKGPTASSLEGEWSIVYMEMGGRPVPLRGDATATLRNNVLTFPDAGNRVNQIRIEFAPKNVLLASYRTAADRSPSDPTRRNPRAEGNPNVKKTDNPSRGTDPAQTGRSPNTGDPSTRDRSREKRSSANDPAGPDVGGPGGRVREQPGVNAPRSEDRGTGEGNPANQVTDRAPYNTGTYIRTQEYLTLQVKFPLDGPTETIGPRDRRPVEKGGSPSPVDDKARGGVSDIRRPERPRDVGPDVTVNEDLVLILHKAPSKK
jgi:hypothetical protein